MYVASVRVDGRVGATTEVATLVAYGLGALAGHGQIVLALAAALVTVALLDTKAPLHGLLQRIQHDELRSALKLLLVSAVLLPILPDQGYGPGGVLNPRKLWWIVILVAGLSLAGHFARRFAGERVGPILTGLFGGLVSSTAVTVSAARLAAKTSASSTPQAASVAAAQAMMCVRIAIIAAVLNPGLAPVLGTPMGCAAAAALFSAHLLLRRRGARQHAAASSSGEAERRPEKAPDDLGAAIVFAGFLALVILASHYARGWFGLSGLFATAALAGLVDVDAITVTAATLPDAALSTVVGAILVAAAVNSLIKIAVAGTLGPRGMALRVAAVVAGSFVAGAAGFAATLL